MIYTLGTGTGRKQMTLATLLAIVESLKIEIILDWRTDGANLAQKTLRTAFGEKYRYVATRCNAQQITASALNRLATMTETVLLLFPETFPLSCPRHEHLALPLLKENAKVAHILEDEVIEAGELQASIDEDRDYDCSTWAREAADPLVDVNEITVKANAPLSEKCIIVQVTLGGFGNRRKVKTHKREAGVVQADDETGGVVVTDGDPKMIRATKSLMDSPELAAINSHDSQTREWLYSRCLPSPFHKGMYLTPYKLWGPVEQYLRIRIAERAALVKAFVLIIPQRIREAEELLGHNFNPGDYAAPEDIGARFVFTRQYLEYGASTKLQELNREAFEESRAMVQQQWAEANTIIMQSVRAGFKVVVDNMVAQLTEQGAAGKKRKIYDTMLPKLNEFLFLFNDRNLANDTQLEPLVELARKIVKGVDTNTLRDNEATRAYIGKQFAEIQTVVAGMIVDRPKRAYHFDD